MIKGNYGHSYQQSLNEIFASTLHAQQGWSEYTPYYLVKVQVDGNWEGLGCMCYDSGNSMFYNIPYQQLNSIKINEIKTHSFIEKESKLLQYVQNRDIIDLDKAEMNFSLYEKDVLENHIRIPQLRNLYEKKREKLRAFQKGKDIWKNERWSS